MENDTITRDKMSLNGLGMIIGPPVSISNMFEKGMEVEEDVTVLKYWPPIPQTVVRFKYRRDSTRGAAGTGIHAPRET